MEIFSRQGVIFTPKGREPGRIIRREILDQLDHRTRSLFGKKPKMLGAKRRGIHRVPLERDIPDGSTQAFPNDVLIAPLWWWRDARGRRRHITCYQSEHSPRHKVWRPGRECDSPAGPQYP